jgi:hypothetical protein
MSPTSEICAMNPSATSALETEKTKTEARAALSLMV